MILHLPTNIDPMYYVDHNWIALISKKYKFKVSVQSVKQSLVACREHMTQYSVTGKK